MRKLSGSRGAVHTAAAFGVVVIAVGEMVRDVSTAFLCLGTSVSAYMY